ncbi:MAG: T9SS type A sorting domain-containing protein, partial [Bacteroidota bacterium]
VAGQNPGKIIFADQGLHVNLQNTLLEAGSTSSNVANIDPVYEIPTPSTIDRIEDLGGNLFNQNPQFVQATSPYNLRLMVSSPARNAGNNLFVPTGISKDYTNINNRILENQVDMGAYEYCSFGDGACNNVGINPRPRLLSSQESVGPLTIYPNPIQEVIHLQMDSEEEVLSASLNNLQGEELIRWNQGNDFKIERLEKGIYLLKLQTKEGVRMIRVKKD